MKSAIDRRYQGREEELSAEKVDVKSLIQRSEGFFCPECGEPVSYVKASVRGSLRHCHFKHHKQQEEHEIDCDLRVDGQGNYSYYERVGLPLFLKRNKGNFTLNLGFFGMTENLMPSFKGKGVDISIFSGQQSQKIHIDLSNNSNHTTLKKIDFIPKDSKNFKLVLPKTGLMPTVGKKWGDFADGIAKAGAIFTYSEYGGKKLRRNDTITSQIPYILMSRNQAIKSYRGVKVETLGSIKLENTNFSIYKILINTSNNIEFGRLESYFWDSFKIKLLHQKPQLFSCWPPMAQSNGVQYTCGKNTVIAEVKSEKKEPELYTYTDTKPLAERILVQKYGNRRITYGKFKVRELTPVTVDRKYMANGYLFSTKTPLPKLSKRKLFHFEQISVDNTPIEQWQEANIPPREEILQEAVAVENEKRKTITDEELLELVTPCLEGVTMVIPRQLTYLLHCEDKFPKTYRALKSVLVRGRVQVEVVGILGKELSCYEYN